MIVEYNDVAGVKTHERNMVYSMTFVISHGDLERRGDTVFLVLPLGHPTEMSSNLDCLGGLLFLWPV